MKKYSELEQKQLMMNPFVLFIKDDKAIEYDPVFKLWCVYMKLNHPERSCKSLFKECNFDLDLLNSRLPYERIKSWENKYFMYGYSWYYCDRELSYADKIKTLCEWYNPEKRNINNSELVKRIYLEVKEFIANEERCSCLY